MYNRKSTRKILTIVLSAILVVVIVVLAIQLLGASQNNTQTSIGKTVESKSLGKWNEGTVTWNGESYLYNKNLKTYLFMGIDKDGVVEKTKDYTAGGQSDALMLMVVDSEAKTVRFITIHRNSMVLVDVNDAKDNSLGTITAQICVQHGFGDGAEISCIRTENTVSRMFDNIPIAGYIAMNMGGIATVNDAIGGVEVTVQDDLTAQDPALKKGAVVTLTGQQAYYYCRYRDSASDEDTASYRYARQDQYIQAFLKKFVSLGSEGVKELESAYEKASPYFCTDMSVTDMLSGLEEYTFETDNLYSVPGVSQMGEQFHEYIVDEDGLKELIMEIFYQKTS